MSNNKQSSIEFLYNKMYEHRGNITIEEYEQAKAMHEEEIVNSILDNRNITSQVTFKDAVQYYNEKFNNEQ
jgi:hypothetical protein